MTVPIRIVGSLLLAFGAALCFATNPALAMDNVTLRTDIFFHGLHAPFFLGIEKGFYKSEGIELAVKPGTGSGTVIKLVGNKNDDFGFADAATLVKAVTEGVPVKMVMGILQESPMVIVSLKDSGITKPSDLPGIRPRRLAMRETSAFLGLSRHIENLFLKRGVLREHA